MYGRGSKSIAEQMGVTTKEADSIIEEFFKGFPQVAQYIIASQEHALEYGFVETATGRRRRLPDMQLDEYEIKSTGDGKSEAFDPFDFDGETGDLDYVPDEVIEKYYNLMNRAWGFAKKNEVKAQALAEGYEIHDNGGKIADAERQCLNSIIQGTAACMSKYAMVKVHADEYLKELGFRLLIPVHDELIGEAPEENAAAAGLRLAEIMIESASEIIEVPMSCDAVLMDRWGGDETEIH